MPILPYLKSPFALALFSLVLVGCKLNVVVPSGGWVTTESGAYACTDDQVCEIDVVDFLFNETFVAEADINHNFLHWRKADNHFCGGQTGKCSLSSDVFEGNPVLESLLQSDATFYLHPVFIEKSDLESPSARKCFNSQLYDRGTRSTLITEKSVTGLANFNVDEEVTTVVNGLTSINGRPAIKISTQGRAITHMYIPSKQSSFEQQTDTISNESYYVVDADQRKVSKIASLTRRNTTQGDLQVLFAGESYRDETFKPGLAMLFDIASGESFDSSNQTHVTSETKDKGSKYPKTEVYEETIDDELRYMGTETITVPAGVFPTCRFIRHRTRNREEADTVSTRTETITEWYGVGNGLLIKSSHSGRYSSTSIKLVKGTINGTTVLPPAL